MKKLPDINKNHDEEDLAAWIKEIDGVCKSDEVEEICQKPLIIETIGRGFDCKGLYNHNSFSELVVGEMANIDRNTAEKFVAGKMKIQAVLDLHGSREKDAFEQLQNFIITNYNQGKRCLLIITGKGKNSEVWWESKGVLRQALPNWLNNPEIRPYILAVANAKQEDGGSGAFYCLLKRKR